MKLSWTDRVGGMLAGHYNNQIMVVFIGVLIVLILAPMLGAQEPEHNWRAWSSAPYGEDMHMTAHLICNTEKGRCAFATVEREDTPLERSVVASGPLVNGPDSLVGCMTFDMAQSSFYDASVLIGRTLCLQFTPDLMRAQVLSPNDGPTIWLTRNPALADQSYELEQKVVKPKAKMPAMKQPPQSQT